MFDRRIVTADAASPGIDDHLGPVHSMLALLKGFATADADIAASQNDFCADAPSSLAARYASANSVTRRRFDAILREAETIGAVGLRLMVARQGRADAAAVAAARFLGNSIDDAVRRLENLLPARAV